MFPLGAPAASSANADIWRLGYTASTFGGPIHPVLYKAAPAFFAVQALFPNLVDIDSSGKNVGDLAETWSASKNQLVWTFKLRKGGWSDGKPISARDVVFTFNVAKRATGKLALWSQLTANVDSVRAVGARTVVITLKKSDYLAPASFGAIVIVPQHIWAVGGATEESLSSFGNAAPMVGGGPYSLASYDGTSAVFTANRNWVHGKVTTPRFGIRLYKTDDALLLALRSNEIDIAPAFTGALPPGTLPSSLRKILAPNLGSLSFLVNLNNSDHPELRSPKVRKALSLAINREQIAKLAYAGDAAPESSMIFTSAKPWHNQRLKPDPYSPASANALLNSLRFARGSDGVRVANGNRMSYDVLEVTNVVNEQARTLIRQYFQAIGVELREQVVDIGTWAALMQKHQWALSLRINTSATPGLFLMDQFTTLGPQSGAFGGVFLTGYRSVKYDQLYKQLLQPKVSAARAKSVIDQLQELIAATRPYIPVVTPARVVLLRRNVAGVSAGTYGAPDAGNQASWANIRVIR